jgi:hypothetical protein
MGEFYFTLVVLRMCLSFCFVVAETETESSKHGGFVRW